MQSKFIILRDTLFLIRGPAIENTTGFVGTGDSFTGGKRTEREIDHAPPISAGSQE
jgi:hypothetical protein